MYSLLESLKVLEDDPALHDVFQYRTNCIDLYNKKTRNIMIGIVIAHRLGSHGFLGEQWLVLTSSM